MDSSFLLTTLAAAIGLLTNSPIVRDNEADMIKKIATDTSNMLNNFTPSNDFDGLVGMGAHWENLKSILCLGSDEVRMIGIWGPPGIGKTTIARVAFNQLSNSFQLSVFMDDLKANSSRLCSDDYSFPKYGFEELAREVTRLSGELPLGLRVMGSYLRGMSKEDWTNSLPRLRDSLDTDIQSILKFSYDALDDEDKDLFLHIACFFSSEQIHKMEEHLAKRFLYVRQRLKVLAEKSLISIDSGRIRMHSLLEKLGREIVCKQSIHEPGQRQFLYDKRDICEVLTGGATGSKSVIGIKFEYYRIREEIDISEKAFEGMSNLQFLKVCGFTDALQITGGLNYLSHKLRLLEWRHFPMTCLPCTVNLEFLVELVMPYSKLEKLWEGCKPLRCLKWMDLGYSVNLKELPDLSTATNLEKLYLYDCSSLVKLPSMSGNSLEKLNIGGCSSLVEFPSFIGNAVNLQELDLSSFPNLLELPSYVGNATNLEYLDLRNCLNMVELPLSLGNLKKLKRLRLKGCSKLEVLPTNINLEYLNELDIAGCSSLDLGDFSTIGNAVNLRELNISSLPQLLEVPSFIGNATNLENLVLSSCSKLVELPLFIGNLQKLRWLRLEGCIRLEVLPTNINLESLLELNLSDCSMLKSFPQISTNLEKLNLRGTAIEQVPPSIRSWPHLKELHMSYFENLKEFPHALERITSLSLTDTEIQEVPPLVKQISRLNRFFLSGCRKLVRLPPISESTHSIYANDCDSLEILECSFSNQIRRLNFANCFKLNQEARDLIIQASSEHAVLPGGKVPPYFTHRATGGGPLTITLNENPLPESMTFKACILLLNKGDHEACSKEKSRGVDVVNNNIIFGLYPALAEHLYTFRINLEVTSRKLLFEFKLMSDDDDWKIGECGIVQQ
ncbi:hypothetical protein IGI04_009168 [Brassica rapa subsp. trilocularis]|uniref:NB-ARC domain-containing protein n=1 Tax=Brassica rapa subsp. trilocularis TaxID=1813537 RepID=A0ABQ7MZU9_BRACM|nr:hypothetical protein IGI04_009168 [Brassica rapa subsp. trilocularis]